MTAAEGITAKSGPQIDQSDCTIRQNECLPYNNKGLLTEREVCKYCEISDRGFLVCKMFQCKVKNSLCLVKNRGLIFHSTDPTSEVNNQFIMLCVMLCYVIQLMHSLGAFQWPITSGILRLLLT